MNPDILLDDDNGRVCAQAFDLTLDHPERRCNGSRGVRRALVHDQGDRLTINYANDYPGGVRINKVSLNLSPKLVKGADIRLPNEGTLGDLILVQNQVPGAGRLREASTDFSLWLCIGHSPVSGAEWQRLQLAETVYGSE